MRHYYIIRCLYNPQTHNRNQTILLEQLNDKKYENKF